ncbi:DUF692 domain-containing protein [Inhella gelatinilytica]|uniref:DUF692 domain-containing protein n=1 Tax=Inhella gelatinilytica TaxID=2795030 RepID=UPI001FE66424|nr:DUF692 domain-containing protein [Inhella gelatinilytica]
MQQERRLLQQKVNQAAPAAVLRGWGLGYRREMADWDVSAIPADFFEVAPENWLRRDRERLHELRAGGRAVHLHGVSLNLGGTSPVPVDFLRQVRHLMAELGTPHYSDHLAASGDAHQLYDLFPIPFTETEADRVADRIRAAQDVLGCRMAVENATWYTNVGGMGEAEFVARVLDRADCQMLLDVNNLAVNHKNHGGLTASEFVATVDPRRVSYVHVAGHEFDERFGLHIDTHSQPVEPPTAELARRLRREWGCPVLLEWDNDVPDLPTLKRELQWLASTTT